MGKLGFQIEGLQTIDRVQWQATRVPSCKLRCSTRISFGTTVVSFGHLLDVCSEQRENCFADDTTISFQQKYANAALAL